MPVGLVTFAQKTLTDTAQRARMVLGGLWQPLGVGTVKSGIVADGGGVASIVGGGSMNFKVSKFRGVVQGSAGAAQGAYMFATDRDETVTIPNTAGSPVTYRIGVLIQDNAFDGTDDQDCTLIAFDLDDGAPDGSFVPMWDIDVPSGTSSGTGGLTGAMARTDRREFVVANGGVQPVLNGAGRDIFASNPGGVRVVARLDTGKLEYSVGTGPWLPIQPEITSDAAVLNLIQSPYPGANVWENGSGEFADLTVDRWGELVYVSGAIKNTFTQIAAGMTDYHLTDVPAGFRPPSTILAGLRTLPGRLSVWCTINPAGELKFSANPIVPVNETIYFFFTYKRA